MKTLLIIISLLGLTACAGMKPQDQVIAEVIYTEALGSVLDANPTMKPVIINIANEANGLLDTKTVITHSGASKWLSEQIAGRLQDNPRVRRLSFILISSYMPDWANSTLSLVTQDERDMLKKIIFLTINAAI